MTGNSSENIRQLRINQEFIELYKILKLEDLVQSGGEAKFVISKGLVRVNNHIEKQKRKKIRPGDSIEYKGHRIQITSP